jgi:Asp/Glu/hydantoin racemase
VRILIINPNSDLEMTAAIQRSAESFADGEYDVVCKPTPGAPKYVKTYEDQLTAAPGRVQLVRESEDGLQAYRSEKRSEGTVSPTREIPALVRPPGDECYH